MRERELMHQAARDDAPATLARTPATGVASTVAPCALPGSPLAHASAGIDACVHCGFCLPACPTYLALEDENDSPRGRIVLMRELLDGTLSPADPVVGRHIDQCLGCRACETACPSGVPYGQLLEATRATLRATRPTPLLGRLVLAVFARPALLSLALFGGRVVRALGLASLGARLPGTLGFASAMLESTRPVTHVLNAVGAPTRRPRQPQPPASSGVAAASLGQSTPLASSGTAVMLTGCVMHGLQRHTNDATARVLAANGYTLIDAPAQGCCGALHAHAGDLDSARALARRNITAFEATPGARIAVNAAGCGAMLKEYGHLLHDDPAWADRATVLSARVADVSELLAAAGPRPASLPHALRVTYDAPCHLQHAQRITAPPLQVLGAITNLELVPLTDSDQCCGSAGIYNLIEPHVSDAVLAPKLQHIARTEAALVSTGNPGCLMQLGAGLRRSGSATRVVHPVDLLDAAYHHDGVQ